MPVELGGQPRQLRRPLRRQRVVERFADEVADPPPCIRAKAGLTATTLRLRGSMIAIPRVVRSKLSSQSVRSSEGSISGA